MIRLLFSTEWKEWADDGSRWGRRLLQERISDVKLAYPNIFIYGKCNNSEENGRKTGRSAGAGQGAYFLRNYGVDITVWKTLWRMCKTHGAGTFRRVTVWLWEILRNNIFVKFL